MTTRDERERERKPKKNDNKIEFTLVHKKAGRLACRHTSVKKSKHLHSVWVRSFFVCRVGDLWFCRFIMSSESVLTVFAHTHTHDHYCHDTLILCSSSSCNTNFASALHCCSLGYGIITCNAIVYWKLYCQQFFKKDRRQDTRDTYTKHIKIHKKSKQPIPSFQPYQCIKRVMISFFVRVDGIIVGTNSRSTT